MLNLPEATFHLIGDADHLQDPASKINKSASHHNKSTFLERPLSNISNFKLKLSYILSFINLEKLKARDINFH